MSIATFRPPSAVYREDQFFAWWIYAILAVAMSLVCFIVGWNGPPHPAGVPVRSAAPVAILLVLSPLVLILVCLLRMTTLVTPLEIRIWFGLVPTCRMSISLDSIRSVAVVRYRPLADTKGWGVRVGPDGERVFSARGDRAVRLLLNDGSRLLVGSQRPELLAEAIDRARESAS